MTGQQWQDKGGHVGLEVEDALSSGAEEDTHMVSDGSDDEDDDAAGSAFDSTFGNAAAMLGGSGSKGPRGKGNGKLSGNPGSAPRHSVGGIKKPPGPLMSLATSGLSGFPPKTSALSPHSASFPGGGGSKAPAATKDAKGKAPSVEDEAKPPKEHKDVTKARKSLEKVLTADQLWNGRVRERQVSSIVAACGASASKLHSMGHAQLAEEINSAASTMETCYHLFTKIKSKPAQAVEGLDVVDLELLTTLEMGLVYNILSFVAQELLKGMDKDEDARRTNLTLLFKLCGSDGLNEDCETSTLTPVCLTAQVLLSPTDATRSAAATLQHQLLMMLLEKLMRQKNGNERLNDVMTMCGAQSSVSSCYPKASEIPAVVSQSSLCRVEYGALRVSESVRVRVV